VKTIRKGIGIGIEIRRENNHQLSKVWKILSLYNEKSYL